MFNANANSHYKTLKGWTKSAEYSRAKLREQIKEYSGGIYKVLLDNSDTWQIMDKPPSEGVTEWLYLNPSGVPLYHWHKDKEGLTII